MGELNHFRTYEIAESSSGVPLELAREGARVVCLGFDTTRRRFVEITALGDGDGDEDGFLDRCAAVAARCHPSVATLVDYGSEDGVFFYASDFVDGEPLGEYSARVGSVPPELACGWMLSLAEGAADLEADGLRAGIDNARVGLGEADTVVMKIVDYGIIAREVGGIGDEVASELLALCNYQSAGEEPVYPPEIEPVAAALAGLESAAEVVAVFVEHGVKSVAGVVAASPRPRLLFEKELFRRARPEHVLPDRYRPVRRAGECSAYESIVVDTDSGTRSRIVVLPPERLVSERMLDVFDHADLGFEIPVGAFWKHEDFRLIAEPLVAGFHLGEWIAALPRRRARQIVPVLEALGSALSELEAAGLKSRPLHVEDAVIEFSGLADATVEDLLGDVSVMRWPDFVFRIRTHPTMRSLIERGDGEIPDGAEDVLAAAGRGQPLPVGVVFAWYFNLRNRGLRYQAGELVESLREVAEVTDITEAKNAPPASTRGDDAPEAEADSEAEEEPVISPIAAAMGIGASGDEDEEAAGSDEPEGHRRPEEVGDLLDEERPQGQPRSNYLLILFILICAIAVAAAVAHLTGRAFWLD